MHELLESIAETTPRQAHRIRLLGVDCPVERMLVAATFRQRLAGYQVSVNPAFPALHVFPRQDNDAEQDDTEPPAQDHVLQFPQHHIRPSDFPYFVGVVFVMAAMYFPFHPLLLNGIALITALSVCARFRVTNLRWRVRGMAWGWPTPALLVWLAAFMPLLALPTHIIEGSAAPRLLDGAIMLFMYQVLREKQAQFMAKQFAAGDPGGKESVIAPIEEFIAQFVLWLSILLAVIAFSLWLSFPAVRVLAEWFNNLTFVQFGWNERLLLDGATGSAMAFLVIAPSATLLLLRPALFAVCLRKASAMNIHCASVEALNTLEEVRLLVLRKTGILTEARPVIKEIAACGETPAEEIVALAAGLEAYSSHPYAEAIRRHAQRKYIEFSAAEEAEESLGMGVAGVIDGQRYLLGSEHFMQEHGIDLSESHHAFYRLARSGNVPVVLANEARALGVIAFSDPLRGDSVRLSKSLQTLSVTPVLLSQNSPELTKTIAEQCGIPKYLAEQTEQDLAAALRQYQKERVGRTAILCLRAPHEKLRERADLLIAQRRSDEAIGDMRADLEVGNGLLDILSAVRLVQLARKTRYQVLTVLMLLLTAAWTLAFVGMIPAIIAPFVPGFLAYYLHLHCERLEKLKLSESMKGAQA